MESIPVLDVSDYIAGGDPEPLAHSFRAAYEHYGFGYLVGHGISPDLISAVFDQARAFHALPPENKMLLAADHTHRGYIPINTSTDRTSKLAKVTKPNQSASLMIMNDDAVVDPRVYLSGPNRWPDLPGFAETMKLYRTEMCALGRKMVQLAFTAAGITDDSALRAFDTPTTWLRLLHYPPRPDDAPEDLFGSAPHTDFGALTFLAQDQVGGLQVMTPDGAWLDAPYLEGSFVMNVGDMLHRMTNGRLRSTPHRVINRSGRERVSCPFFFDPHVHTVIEPLPGTGAPQFQPLRFDDFLRAELEASYDQHAPDNL